MATDELKATDAAIRKAEELGVDISAVEGTGSEGQVTAPDVERTAAELEQAAQEARQAQEEADQNAAEENRVFRVRLNPALGPNTDGVDVGGTFYREGSKVTQKEFEELRKAKIGGVQALLKGAEVT